MVLFALSLACVILGAGLVLRHHWKMAGAGAAPGGSTAYHDTTFVIGPSWPALAGWLGLDVALCLALAWVWNRRR